MRAWLIGLAMVIFADQAFAQSARTMQKLADAYREDTDKADAAYKGKRLMVAAEVESINSGEIGMIVPNARIGGTLTNQDSGKLSRIHPGQMLTMSCIVAGIGLYLFELKECKVISIANKAIPPVNPSPSPSPTQREANFPFPAFRNSPDTPCGRDGHPCSDKEFPGLVAYVRREWSVLPQWIRLTCLQYEIVSQGVV